MRSRLTTPGGRLFLRWAFGGALLGLCAVNYACFPPLFGVSYLSFFTKSGTAVALGLLLAKLSWKEFDKLTGLTSRDPLDYFGCSCQLAGLTLVVVSTRSKVTPDSGHCSAWDRFLHIPFVLVVAFGWAAWLLAIMPAQYFVNFLCSAPSRVLAASNVAVFARFINGVEIQWLETKRSETPPTVDPNPWWDASMRGEEHKLTLAYSAVVIAGLGWVLSATGRA